jgi:hypothetical protein
MARAQGWRRTAPANVLSSARQAQRRDGPDCEVLTLQRAIRAAISEPTSPFQPVNTNGFGTVRDRLGSDRRKTDVWVPR